MAAPLTNLVDEEKFWPMLQALAECLCKSLAEANGPDLCYCGLWLGDTDPPLGVGCSGGSQCGIAWVRPIEVFPSVAFPDPLDAASRPNCSSPLAMTVDLAISRCMPGPKESRQQMPDPQDVYDALRLQMSDMRALRRAVQCCFGAKVPERRDWQYTLGPWAPIPTGARVTGGRLLLTIG